MPVPPETRLGPYEIRQFLGSGGMGEVYIADDLRLQRMAAIKIISERLSEDPNARERFQREARSASKLSHPNICTIYDFGEWEGRQFLAMEYVDGEPLSKRLSHGPLPLEEILDLFIQLASALESAHTRGVIHRDIKPGNILVTANHQLKVVDFGLAKQVFPAMRAVAAGYDTLTAPWVGSISLTASGGTLGTVCYMSPEQARGEELDNRSDLFSFGLVLYEAATGQRALGGDTAAVIFAALLKEEPTPALQLNPALPPELGAIINKAIEKDRELRYQHASDVLTDLRRLKRSVESGTFEHALPAVRRRTHWRAMLIAVAIAAFAVMAAIWFGGRPHRSVVLPPKPQKLTVTSLENPVFHSTLSADSEMVAYGDESGIQLHLIATREAWPLVRSRESSSEEFWWPVAWFPDGNHLLANSASTTSEGIKLAAWSISTHSGARTKLRDDCVAYALSPDGSQIAFTTGGPSLQEEIWVMGSHGEAARRIVASPSSVDEDVFFSSLRWSPDCRRIAFRKEGSYTGRVVVESVALDGRSPVPLASDVGNWGDFYWMPGGQLLFAVAPDNDPDNMNLWELQIDPKSGAPLHKRRQLTDWTGFRIENFSVSRDGGRLTFDKTSSRTDVLVAPLGAKGLLGMPRRLALDDYSNTPFAWANDSKTVFFTSERPSSFLILKQNTVDTEADAIVASSNVMSPVRLTPDGASLLYMEYPTGAPRLMFVSRSGGIPREVKFNHSGMIVNVDCSRRPAMNCLAGTFEQAQHQLTFWSFEPPKTEFQRLFGMAYDLRKGFGWTLSPNGKQVAMNKNYPDHAEVEIHALSGALEHRVRLSGFNRTFSIDWAADGLSWFVGATTATGCSLLRVYPDGHNQVLLNLGRREIADTYTYARPSPNGKELAIRGWTIGRNVWMIDHISSLLEGR